MMVGTDFGIRLLSNYVKTRALSMSLSTCYYGGVCRRHLCVARDVPDIWFWSRIVKKKILCGTYLSQRIAFSYFILSICKQVR